MWGEAKWSHKREEKHERTMKKNEGSAGHDAQTHSPGLPGQGMVEEGLAVLAVGSCRHTVHLAQTCTSMARVMMARPTIFDEANLGCAWATKTESVKG